ncbi:FtsW/RodA/SpoVE family cell cycle protein [Microbacterium sp. EYE_5]|uniref:FtsW/RodA/SpoVE family cell cycle protein n=1 Tax=unclassified Microbacterium TaxID=2609290 RepID=UPI002003AADA|nr:MULTISPECIES: FtsW/RodA/SpoVE family cell cycle protein [unclassified Microbacterium]MCK6079611.1 FtsW/RodA/SpoVE family cell cycle protein [Microbacterium sp. EYE_382]MCK6084882.1 FtsW/RodA/SpoVE family cell cycle protein [Microbacterium sp. EYE_384]MCK6122892.1 FtsW/RodA/SpoVE family cell cycle protein [Microbacterium sp. EYE_80]MCK6125645.1 FtsW/RodA/SpoVE family cell cycle protein [Microbacterium sp. EYE_79]MCK6140566.1 FtsW/RodA/SpoVE family cell cycle protein [Microbacterium sp. EYE_3
MTASIETDTTVIKALRKLRMPATQRNRELGLLLFAIIITTAATVLVQFGTHGELDPTFLSYTGALAGLALALHVVTRICARDADPFVVPIATLLTGLGVAMIYRLDISADRVGWGSLGLRQLVWAAIAIGGAILIVVFLRNYRILFRYTYIFGVTGILLLLLPFVPGLGLEAGADVWVSIAGVFSFQPGELAKICLAIFFAGYLVRTREALTSVGTRFLGITWPKARQLGPLLIIWAASLAIIVFQRDLGTGILIFGMFIAMLYVATGKASWAILGLLLAVAGALAASQILPYVGSRFSNWLDAFNPDYVNGSSYQLVSGIFGLAHGGLIGTGWGLGRPNLTPLAHNDYILPSLGEELGLVGVFAILVLYMVFVSRGIRVGIAGQDDFGKLLATGLSFTLALQVFIMVGGVTRLIPLTGLTMPFLAAGGSSLIANFLIIGILLRISDAVRSRPRVVIG